MKGPFTRGSAWGRAQPEHLRPGSFKRGHEKRGGRKRGTPNLLSVDYKKAILEAAYRIGYDGNGKNGVCGYSFGSASVTRKFSTQCCLPVYCGLKSLRAARQRAHAGQDTKSTKGYGITLGLPTRIEQWGEMLRLMLGASGVGPANLFLLAVSCNSPSRIRKISASCMSRRSCGRKQSGPQSAARDLSWPRAQPCSQ